MQCRCPCCEGLVSYWRSFARSGIPCPECGVLLRRKTSIFTWGYLLLSVSLGCAFHNSPIFVLIVALDAFVDWFTIELRPFWTPLLILFAKSGVPIQIALRNGRLVEILDTKSINVGTLDFSYSIGSNVGEVIPIGMVTRIEPIPVGVKTVEDVAV